MSGKEIILDAKGKSLGRLASEAASVLRGKTSADFERHIAPSQKVLIKNASGIRISGKKLSQKKRSRYSGYPGGLKKISLEKIFKKDPRKALFLAISGMIPANRLKKNILKNLIIHAAE